MKKSTQREYDKSGYMSFGKHTGTKFECVPVDYLAYCLREMDWNLLKKNRPNFYQYLMDHYEDLQQDDYL